MKKLIIGLLCASVSLFASQNVFYEYAKVVNSKPVYKTIEIAVPHAHGSECYEEYHVQKPRRQRVNENNIGLDTIIGVVSGVAIGNQIGKGNGRTAAKVIGGIVGGTVANKIRNYHYEDDSDYYYESKRRVVCSNESNSYETKRVLKGYKNYFYYNGKKYYKFTKRPKNRIRITTTMNF